MKQNHYIDVHSHILPGIDDGAKDYDISMQMLETALNDGISRIILTPHNKPGRPLPELPRLREKADRLQAQLSGKGMEAELYIGSELYYRSELVSELESGQALTLAGSRYILVEFGFMDDFDYIRSGIYTLLAGGYYPILAHAERYRSVCMKKTGISDLVEMGSYIQLNAGSILGMSGWKVRQFTRSLLKQHLVHFIATDAHDTKKRAPYLADCADYVEKKYGREYAGELFIENPLRILREGSDGKTQR